MLLNDNKIKIFIGSLLIVAFMMSASLLLINIRSNYKVLTVCGVDK